MRDPRVQKIHYRVSSEGAVKYNNPSAISFSNHLGSFDLSNGELQIVPAEHFPDEYSARQVLEPFLRSWEIEADITSSVGTIRFAFKNSEVVDRNPPPPGSPHVVDTRGVAAGLSSANASIESIRNTYPEPPMEFRATPEVQLAYRRWLDYRQGKEPLLSMAYFVLTLLETDAGGRQQAANSFQIDIDILRKIGELSSNRGDETTARKVKKGIQLQNLAGPERHWLEVVIPLVIHRLGERATGAPLPKISMGDLPQL